MTNHEPLAVKLNGANDLIALVPYLLGFHPHDSLVAVALADRRITQVGRLDLPHDTPIAPAALTHLAATVTHTRADTVVLIAYGPADPAASSLSAAADAFTAAGIRVHDRIRVTNGRYFHDWCRGDCCPPDGKPVNPDASPLPAQATVAGMVALPDRAALVAQVAAITGPQRQAMRKATNRATQRLTKLTRNDDPRSPAPTTPNPSTGTPQDPQTSLGNAANAAIVHAIACYRRGSQLDNDEAAWLTVLLHYPAVRDLAWTYTDSSNAVVAMWTDLTRRAEPALVPAPATLLAFAAWRGGDGPLASAAVDRALQADPDDSLARLMSDILRNGVPPSVIDDSLTQTDEPAPED